MVWQAPDVTVVGGGMAGSECAWQLAQAGLRVTLVDSKPAWLSPAHHSPLLGELVCSNSLRSDEPLTPAGMLKRELRAAGSLVIACADGARVPAGAALAVERQAFSRAITARLALHPRIQLERRVAEALPDGEVVIATGPLTAGALGQVIRRELGGDRMYFYDAIAPIVAADSIDMDHAFRASRWERGGRPARTKVDRALRRAKRAARAAGAPLPPVVPVPAPVDVDDASAGGDVGVGDYINCPLTREQYYAFVEEIRAGRKVLPHEFEEPRYFESCMPVEVMADRGVETLRYGPMKPLGLDDPRTGRWPFAVVQLRPENRHLTAYNMVGFQTRLAYPEQQRIFAMVPALAHAEFVRFGSIHRNTYIDAPAKLGPRLELRASPRVHVAGLLTGVEGYIESCAMGLMVAWLIAGERLGHALLPPPATTMMGALYAHAATPREGSYRYSPTNVNYGLLPPLVGDHRKDNKKPRMAERAVADFDAWVAGRRGALGLG
ncbi:MAG: methylenetetrahydrofolate--tRNA-(uracil(54)-C(5))-methyltransferase (FADH(2)-oxidizing) TrmFO [Kofleriaceae bacterium]